MGWRCGGQRFWAGAALVFAMATSCGQAALAQDDGGGQDQRPGLPAGSQMVRGTVSASSADSLTLKTETGETYKVTVTPSTRVMKQRQAVKLGDVKAGDGVGAMGVMDASTKTLHAVFVTVVDAEQVRKAQEDLGKTYIVGKVTAIDELKLTIKRPDGVAQTIEVDEGTSFRKGGRGMAMMMGGGGGAGGEGTGAQGRAEGQRTPRQGEGGESITLADIKVGDSIAGRGALKSGTFVPTELRVMDPAARGRRRAGADGAAGPGAPAAAPATPAPAGAPQ